MEQPNTIDLAEMTSDIIADCVTRNHVQAGDLPELIKSIH